MEQKKKLLILGGTEFVGRQLVERLLNNKEIEVFLFNRGKTNPNLFLSVKKIIGDRTTKDIQQISQHQWNYVVDFSCYFPKDLEQTLLHLNHDIERYIFISTISVYNLKELDLSLNIKEDAKKKEYTTEQLTEAGLKFYGEKKIACEDLLNKTPWLQSIILRPSIIYGRYDPTERLYYWIERIKKQNQIILPENGKHAVSLTYSDDLVAVILASINSKLESGVYNFVSDKTLPFHLILKEICNQLNTNCEFIPMEWKQLKSVELSPKHFPFCFGASIKIDNTKLKKTLDIDSTSIEASIQSTIDYYVKQGWPRSKVGLSFEEENKIITDYYSTAEKD